MDDRRNVSGDSPEVLHGFPLGDRYVGGERCFVIAEAGVNHNGRAETAHALVDSAADAGADAVKFQTFSADRLVTADAGKAAYQEAWGPEGQTQHAMLKALELNAAVYPELVDHCRRRGVLFLSSPFDEESADFLEGLGVAGFKIASGELTNLPLLRHVARKGRPMIVSTGMATISEVQVALDEVRTAGNGDIALLHCVSKYPAQPADVNLRAMSTLADECGVPVGYSDHTLGIEIALAAAALGACVLEKHVTISRAMPGPDHAASLEGSELSQLVRGVRVIEQALGTGRKVPAPGEAEVAAVVRKSIVAARHIPAGTSIDAAMLVLRRPGTGLPASAMPRIVGAHARVDIPAGSLLTPEMFE